MEPTIIFDNVSKKFSKGYVSDSLRDALASPFKRFFSWNGNFLNRLLRPVRQFGPVRPVRPVGQVRPLRQKDEFWALKDVSFEVRPGEALGIIGPNGSGKSTTLKLLSRILRPDGGKIFVKGRVGALIELGAGFHPDLTGRENIFLNASILGMSKEEIKEKYDEIVDFAELHDFMDMPVKWYSSGMHAKLGFSVAANTSPDILLVDEVLSVGDVGFQSKCLEKMQSFRTRGTTIVFISHNMQSVSSLCDRVVLLNKGVVKQIGGTEETISYYMGSFKKDRLSSSAPVELKKGLLYDEAGAECLTFKSGQRARVEIDLKFTDSLPNVYATIGVILKRPRQLVAWINSASLGGQSLSVSKGQIVNLSVDFLLNLASGEYEFNATIYDPIENKTIWEDYFAPFVIQKNTKCNGIVFMNPKLVNQKITTTEE
jgi:ABC-type polysaccharide/polyol phosphate transport system ATPase subunit